MVLKETWWLVATVYNEIWGGGWVQICWQRQQVFWHLKEKLRVIWHKLLWTADIPSDAPEEAYTNICEAAHRPLPLFHYFSKISFSEGKRNCWLRLMDVAVQKHLQGHMAPHRGTAFCPRAYAIHVLNIIYEHPWSHLSQRRHIHSTNGMAVIPITNSLTFCNSFARVEKIVWKGTQH